MIMPVLRMSIVRKKIVNIKSEEDKFVSENASSSSREFGRLLATTIKMMKSAKKISRDLSKKF